MGALGLKARVEEYLEKPRDEEAKAFYEGILIMVDALLNFNGKHTETGTLEKAIGLLRVAEYLRIP